MTQIGEGEAEQGKTVGKVRFQLERSLQQLDRSFQVAELTCELVPSFQVELVDLPILGRPLQPGRSSGTQNRLPNVRDDRCDNVVMDGEGVAQLSIVVLRPKLEAGRRPCQPDGDS